MATRTMPLSRMRAPMAFADRGPGFPAEAAARHGRMVAELGESCDDRVDAVCPLRPNERVAPIETAEWMPLLSAPYGIRPRRGRQTPIKSNMARLVLASRVGHTDDAEQAAFRRRDEDFANPPGVHALQQGVERFARPYGGRSR